jgi:antitoxin YefM
MDVMNYSDARAQFKGVMDRAIHDKQEVNETLHLLSSPRNAARLRSSIAQLDAVDGDERALIE